MITVILLILLAIVVGTLIAQKKFQIIQFDNAGKAIGFRYKPIVFTVIALLIIIFQPYSLEKIDAGSQGLLVDLVSDSRGASNIEEVSGRKLYNTWFYDIEEIPLDFHHIEYDVTKVTALGGFICDITPTFSYRVKRVSASVLFTDLRSTYKQGGLNAIASTWLNTAIIGAVNDVANKWSVDKIFLDKSGFENAIVREVNKRAGKYFDITQLKTNILPPAEIRKSIGLKAKADADVAMSESQAKAAIADAQRKIAIARGDSATVVIKASSEAQALKLKQRELTPLYIEYIKAQTWNGVLPTTSLGNNSGTLLNLK